LPNSDDWSKRLRGVRAAVWGDLCLDRYRYGEVRELAREAPVAALHLQKEVFCGGQAANVAFNLRALGAEVSLVGIIGNDAEGGKLKEILLRAGIDCNGIINTRRATELREKIVAGSLHQPSQHILHVYRESTCGLGESLRLKLLHALEIHPHDLDLLVITDYGNGMCRGTLSAALIALAKKHGLKTVANTRCGIRPFAGCGGMVINARQALGQSPQQLLRQMGWEWLLVTAGAKGMNLYQSGTSRQVDPPGKLPLVDITGAGDTVLAWMAAGWAAGLDLDTVLDLANLAAQVSVSQPGTSAPTVDEIRNL